MGMLKDALGPAMGAGQANNGLNGAMSKMKGMFGQKNGSSPAPESWRPPSPARSPEPRRLDMSRNDGRRDDGEDDFSDSPPPYDSRREGSQPAADRRVISVPQAYDEYDPSPRPPRKVGRDDPSLHPRPPFDGRPQYGRPPQAQQYPQGSGMGPSPFGSREYGDNYGGRRPRRDRGDRRGRRAMQQGYGGGGYGGYGGNGAYGGGRGYGGMGGYGGIGMYGGGGGC